jgi:hypothetical protein
MRNYSKVGGKKGMPGYRTPSSFRYKKHIEISKGKNITKKEFKGKFKSKGE